MTRYNPRTWFRSPEDLSKLTLYCANPQCEDPVIRDIELAYNEKEHEIYHSGECQLLAVAHKAFSSKGTIVGNMEFITQEEAARLILSGKIKQRPGLEGRVK